MNTELTKNLFDTYPKIFPKKDQSLRNNLMYFGFETDDGWYWLIDNLCKTIQSYIDCNQKSQVTAVQVKEKFGTLRFYLDFSENLIDGMIWFAENLSGTICERCGTTKDVGTTSGWIKTICKGCVDKNQEWTANTIA